MHRSSPSVSSSLSEKVVTETQVLLDAVEKCSAIWSVLGRYRKNGKLSYKDVMDVYFAQKSNFQDLLLVNSPDELVDLLDEDEDGYLDEDEQLLLFSLVKERMQVTAKALCVAKEYNLYERIMQQIRLLEDDILKYQQELRRRIYDQELKSHKAFHRSKMEKFTKSWEQRIQVSELGVESQLRNLDRIHQEEAQKLSKQFDYKKAERKVKPREVVLKLENEERLAAITEKYSEANRIHKFLSQESVAESGRVHQAVQQEFRAQERLLKRKQHKELNYAKQKADMALQMLKKRMAADRLRLHKEICNSLATLKKVQSEGYNAGKKAGLAREELRRSKEKSKNIITALSDYRQYSTTNSPLERSKSLNYSQRSLFVSSSLNTSKLNSQNPLKDMKGQVSKFNLKAEALRVEAPVISNAQNGLSRRQIMRQMVNTVNLKPLSEMYDADLRLVDEGNEQYGPV